MKPVFAHVISAVRYFLVMVGKSSKSWLIFLVALVIGSIGACGQAFLIHHNLVGTYPYKIMSNPLAEFYAEIANVGFYVALISAVILGFLLGLKRFWLATLVPVVVCPLVFALIFRNGMILDERSCVIRLVRNFDDLKPEAVAQSFYFDVASYAIAGLIIGAICCFLLSRLTKEKILP